MIKLFFIALLTGVILAQYVPTAAAPSREVAVWARWLEDQVSRHPDVTGARAAMEASLSLADAKDQPVYNPELATEYEREGKDDNYRVGINQTVDLWDKQGKRSRQAEFDRQAAQQEYELTVQQKTADALRAMIGWQTAKELARLNRTQEEQMNTLLDLINKRQQVGDLGEVDVEVAYLNLSQRLNATAESEAALHLAEADLQDIFVNWNLGMMQVPEDFLAAITVDQAGEEEWLDNHPAVRAARAGWEAAQESARLARSEAKPDPTFGLNGGATGDDGVVAITFSIPLHIRNTYRAEVEAAGRQSTAAKANYLAVRRRQQARIFATRKNLLEYGQRFKRYHDLMHGRRERSRELLKRQWSSGDMDTTEYLLALEQRTQGLIAGIALRSRFELSKIDWLQATGQIRTALLQ